MRHGPWSLVAENSSRRTSQKKTHSQNGLHDCRPYVNPALLPCRLRTSSLTRNHNHNSDLRAKPDQESISKLHAKLLEASAVYSKDKETLSWFVMQSVHDPQDFTIVERYLNEGSQKYHLSNPYWKTFDPYVIPLLEKDMDLRRFEELVPASEH